MEFNKHIQAELLNEYAGSERKKTIILDDGKKYLLKFPDPTRNKSRRISYINNAISEYLGCRIFHELGISVQNVIIGEYKDENGNTKIACACEDVRGEKENLYEINKISLSSVEKIDLKTVRFSDIYDFAKNNHIIPEKLIVEFYCDMFVVDAFIGNTDRHNGNWGILSDGVSHRISPVYDCGSCLEPLYSDEDLENIAVKEGALSTYAAICDDDGKRINYYTFLTSASNKDVNEAVKRIVPRINMNKINSIIDNTPYISEIRKTYYKEVLGIRYDRVLKASLKKILATELETEDKHSLIGRLHENQKKVSERAVTTKSINRDQPITGR